VRVRGDHHHACVAALGARGAQRLEQLDGEQPVREVVEGERQLDAVGALLPRVEHRAGVVDEHVHPRVPGADLGGRGAHLGLARQVGPQELGRAATRRGRRPHVGQRLRAAPVVAPDEQHPAAPPDELARRGQADPGRGSGDHAHAPGERQGVRGERRGGRRGRGRHGR
jgi:hypothetical protein